MTAILASATPYRDQAYFTLAAIVEEAWDDLSATCPDDKNFASGWCDRCADLQARVDGIQPILRQLESAGDDDAARAIMAPLFSLTEVTAGIGRAA